MVEPAAQIGEVIDERYRIERLIGRGSMADVFGARDLSDHSGVAVKILRGQIARDAEAVERLKREAQAQGVIRHRNVARVLGGGVTGRGEPYLVVELLGGSSLRRVIKTAGRVAPEYATSYIWQALQGLDAAHAQGVIHRDLKPANLMLEPSPGPVERVVLIDFGFATMQGSARLTKAGHVVGSLAYMAPERLEGDPGSTCGDLYALGVILYELLVGRRPFVAQDEMELIKMQLDAEPPPIASLAPELELSSALEAVVFRALSKAPETRFATASGMAHAIEQAMATGPR